MHKRKLPPLDPLLGFEAAARHLSFTQAASELFLTQSAISRQVQTLEERLGVKLFERQTRRLVLTPQGETLFKLAGEMLERLATLTAEFQAGQRRPKVNVSCSLGLASLWLVPRLASFQDEAPEVDVRISADNRLVDLEREDFDLALRYIAPDAAPHEASLLFEEEVFPVAAPRLAARIPARWRVKDLAQMTLLEFDDGRRAPWITWEPWLAAIGLTHAPAKAVLQFNQYDQLIRAAMDGRGVALGRGPLVARLIAEKRLRALRGPRQSIPTRAYFLVRGRGAMRPEVNRFADWLRREARDTLPTT